MEAKMEIGDVERAAVMPQRHEGEQTDDGGAADGSQAAKIADPFA